MNQMMQALSNAADFYFCPNTNRVICSMKYDDKVMCSCGNTEAGPNVHFKDSLEMASVEDYAKQELAK